MFSPMDEIICAELDATGSPATFSFQTLLTGNTGQFGAPGRTPGRLPGGVDVGTVVGPVVVVGTGVDVGCGVGPTVHVGRGTIVAGVGVAVTAPAVTLGLGVTDVVMVSTAVGLSCDGNVATLDCVGVGVTPGL